MYRLEPLSSSPPQRPLRGQYPLRYSQATSPGVDLSTAYSLAQEIATKFGVPVPTIVVGDYPNPEYVDGVIKLPKHVPPNVLPRVIAHEMAHHIHVYYGVPCSVPEAETFASMFEEAWVRAKKGGYSYPVTPCRVCGFPLYPVSDTVVCPKCRSTYRYSYPGGGLGKAVGVGALSALATYLLATWLEKHPEVKTTPKMTATVASGLVGFIAGLIL